MVRKQAVKKGMAKKPTVAVLAKKVSKLEKESRMTTQYQHLALELNSTLGSGFTTPNLYIAPLCNWSGTIPVFGSSNADLDLANSFYHRGFGLDCFVTNNTETGSINFTAFLVSLKDGIGSAFDQSTGTLNLTNPNHFYNNGLTALTMLNKNAFTIHKVKRFTLSNMDQPFSAGPQTQYGNTMRWYWKQSVNKKCICPNASMKAQNSSLDPSKSYFLILANDNNTLDGEVPIIRATVVHTINANQ